MTIINADKFLAYLIYSKHIDGLTCGEVKKAIEMCKIDVLDKIREEIRDLRYSGGLPTAEIYGYIKCLEIIDKHMERERMNDI